jgi:hypothetical protein
MRALLHVRMTKGSETALLQAVKEHHQLLDLKEASIDGEPIILITIIVAEKAGNDHQFWELPLTLFFTKTKKILEQETAVLLSTLILDGVKLSETGNLSFKHDLLSFLGKWHIGLQIWGKSLKPRTLGNGAAVSP